MCGLWDWPGQCVACGTGRVWNLNPERTAPTAPYSHTSLSGLRASCTAGPDRRGRPGRRRSGSRAVPAARRSRPLLGPGSEARGARGGLCTCGSSPLPLLPAAPGQGHSHAGPGQQLLLASCTSPRARGAQSRRRPGRACGAGALGFPRPLLSRGPGRRGWWPPERALLAPSEGLAVSFSALCPRAPT